MNFLLFDDNRNKQIRLHSVASLRSIFLFSIHQMTDNTVLKCPNTRKGWDGERKGEILGKVLLQLTVVLNTLKEVVSAPFMYNRTEIVISLVVLVSSIL